MANESELASADKRAVVGGGDSATGHSVSVEDLALVTEDELAGLGGAAHREPRMKGCK